MSESKPSVDFSDPCLQSMPESKAILSFLRRLTPHYTKVERPLTDAEWTAFKELARVGAVQGILRWTIDHGGKIPDSSDYPILDGIHYEEVSGRYWRSGQKWAFSCSAKIDMQLDQARLTGKGERFQEWLAVEKNSEAWKSRYSELKAEGLLIRARSIVLQRIYESKSKRGRALLVPAPDSNNGNDPTPTDDKPTEEPRESNKPADEVRRPTKDELNVRARDALKNPQSRSLRKLAKAIGCSPSYAATLPAWTAYQEEKKRRENNQPAGRKAVPLTDGVLANEGREDAELERLIAEQKADIEPNSLLPTKHRPQRRRPAV